MKRKKKRVTVSKLRKEEKQLRETHELLGTSKEKGSTYLIVEASAHCFSPIKITQHPSSAIRTQHTSAQISDQRPSTLNHHHPAPSIWEIFLRDDIGIDEDITQ